MGRLRTQKRSLAGVASSFALGASLAVVPLATGPGAEAGWWRSNSSGETFVFGDSLADTGNIATLTFGTTPDPALGYFPGRFSDGPLWADYFAPNLNLASPDIGPVILDPVAPVGSQGAGGVNFAHGGAVSGDITQSALGPNVTDGLLQGQFVDNQVDLFLTLSGSGQISLDRRDQAFMWVGGNDYIANAQTDPTETVGNITENVRTLLDGGVKNIVVFTLPDLGATPVASELEAAGLASTELLTQATLAHNLLLRSSLWGLKREYRRQGARVETVNIFPLAKLIERRPRLFGFDISGPGPGTTGYCLGDGASDCSRYAFFDNIHPTAEAYEIIARYADARIRADRVVRRFNLPQQSATASVGAGIRQTVSTRLAAEEQGIRGTSVISQGLAPQASGTTTLDDGSTVSFLPSAVADTGRSTFAYTNQSSFMAFSAEGIDDPFQEEERTEVMGFGADQRINDKLLIGALVTWSKALSEDRASSASSELESTTTSFYSRYSQGRIRLDGLVSFTRGLYETERQTGFAFLPTVKGETEGTTTAFDFTAGLNMDPLRMKGGTLGFTPQIRFGYEDTLLAGYREKGSLGLFDETYDAERFTSYGAFVGTEIAGRFGFRDMVIRPNFTLGYAEKLGGDTGLGVNGIGLFTSNTDLAETTLAQAEEGLLLAAGLSLEMPEQDFSLRLNYDALIAADETEDTVMLEGLLRF